MAWSDYVVRLLNSEDWSPSLWEHEIGQQNPSEWKLFVDRMIDMRCESFVGIGALHGGNQWDIARKYSHLGMKCEMLVVDSSASRQALRSFDFINRNFKDIKVDFRICDSSKIKSEDLHGSWDACFIDGCHLYDSVRRDYELVSPLVKKMIGFHDINADLQSTNGQFGVQKLFDEIKAKHSWHEKIVFEKNPWYGIGVVYNLPEKRSIPLH